MLEKKSLAGGAVPRTPLWKLTMLSQSPKLHPRRLENVALAPYVRIAVPKLWPPELRPHITQHVSETLHLYT